MSNILKTFFIWNSFKNTQKWEKKKAKTEKQKSDKEWEWAR